MGSVVNLNAPRIDDGAPLTAAELADYNRQRLEASACCNGDCEQGRQCVLRQPAEAATEVGSGMHREPVAGWAVELAFGVCILAMAAALAVGRWLYMGASAAP